MQFQNNRTKITMSVMWAPRIRMFLKAAWPKKCLFLVTKINFMSFN
jgi:hypothetical protein